ncbi:MAG: glycosyltransferase, partial [Planctomycetota bacterium]
GSLISFFSFLYLPYLGVKTLLGFSVPQVFPLITAFFFLGGMILLGIGVLGLYISSIFLETKGRHNYIIKDTYGFEDESPEKQDDE